MPRSGSEPGQIVVPDDAPTQDAPVVSDDAPAGPQRPAWTSPAPDARTVPEVGRGAGRRQRRVARWIAAMGLTVVGLTAWFAFAHPFGGSSASHASVGSKTGHSLVGSSTEAPTRLTTGVCFNYVDPSAVAVLPCTQPHDSEAYYRYTLSPGPFPGYDAVWEAARNTCNAQLNRYVGPEVRGVFYVTWVLTPGQSEWAAGNRLTVCVLSRIDTGKATGSAHQGHAFGGSSAGYSSVGSSTEDSTRL